MLAYCTSRDIMSKGTLRSFGAHFRGFTPQEHRTKLTKKNELAAASLATSHILSDIIKPGILPQLYSKTSRSEFLSFRLCYSKPRPPKCTLRFITHVGAIQPGKSYGDNIEINEHMELAEWLVHWAPKLVSRVRCSTRSSL